MSLRFDSRGIARGGLEAERRPPPRSGGDRSLVLRAMERATGPLRTARRARRHTPEYSTDGEIHQTSSGLKVVHLHQQHHGVPVYEAMRSVRFDRRRRLLEIGGDVVTIPAGFDTTPTTEPEGAVEAACRYVARDPDNPGIAAFEISPRPARRLSEFTTPSRPTLFRKRPFRGLVSTELTVFGTADGPRLGWVVHLTLPRQGGAYEVVVSADSSGEPAILLCKRALSYAGPEGHVFEFSPGERPRLAVPFRRQLTDYPDFGHDAAGAIPREWVDGEGTQGISTVVFKGNRDEVFVGTGTENGILFRPAEEQGTDQQVLNAFYVCNVLHDFFYLLGFTEAEGNFQERNPSGVGVAGDRLVVRVFGSPIAGMATMRSRRDGNHPELNLGPNAGRHTALDADIVAHEFVHGVSNRMIGGRTSHDPLEGKQQARAMGEGYSDYFAISILNYYRRRAGLPETRVFGAWIGNDAGRGMRRFAYDANFPGTYGSLGRPGFDDAHDAGQVWAMALLNMNDALARLAESDEKGHALGWQIVVDSFHLITPGPDRPSFLDGKLAIYTAFEAIAARLPEPGITRDMRTAIARVFSDLGMGSGARSPTADYAGIVENQDL